MAPKSNPVATATGVDPKLDFAVRLLHKELENPNIKDFSWHDKNYKAKWDMLNKLRCEVFTQQELDDMKIAGKSKVADRSGTPATPGGASATTPKAKSPTKRKVKAVDRDNDDEAGEDATPGKKKVKATPKKGKKDGAVAAAAEGGAKVRAVKEELVAALSEAEDVKASIEKGEEEMPI